MDYLDDDENVKAMRETAHAIGLTDLLLRAARTADQEQAAMLLSNALTLLGVKDTAIGESSKESEM